MTQTRKTHRALLLASSLLLALPLYAADLQVRIEDIAETGSLHVYVFTAPEGFPKEESAVFHQIYPRPEAAQKALDIRLAVPDAPAYAVMVFQDKDGNGKMNRLLGMIPQEPYGLSRNPQLFGKPKFSDAAISPAENEIIVVKLHD